MACPSWRMLLCWWNPKPGCSWCTWPIFDVLSVLETAWLWGKHEPAEDEGKGKPCWLCRWRPWPWCPCCCCIDAFPLGSTCISFTTSPSPMVSSWSLDRSPLPSCTCMSIPSPVPVLLLLLPAASVDNYLLVFRGVNYYLVSWTKESRVRLMNMCQGNAWLDRETCMDGCISRTAFGTCCFAGLCPSLVGGIGLRRLWLPSTAVVVCEALPAALLRVVELIKEMESEQNKIAG